MAINGLVDHPNFSLLWKKSLVEGCVDISIGPVMAAKRGIGSEMFSQKPATLLAEFAALHL
jgi:hypothetical protein